MGLSQKLAKLKKLANRIGYKVIPNKHNQCNVITRQIFINTRQLPKKRAYVLAHEIGHARTLAKCIAELGFRCCTAPAHTWPSLEAELRAWAATDRIMRKLGMYDDEYLQYKHSCIRSYYCK
jgi:hypothetical protein